MTPDEAQRIATEVEAVWWSFGDEGRSIKFRLLYTAVADLAEAYCRTAADLGAKNKGEDITEIAVLKEELKVVGQRLSDRANVLRGTVDERVRDISRLKREMSEGERDAEMMDRRFGEQARTIGSLREDIAKKDDEISELKEALGEERPIPNPGSSDG